MEPAAEEEGLGGDLDDLDVGGVGVVRQILRHATPASKRPLAGDPVRRRRTTKGEGIVAGDGMGGEADFSAALLTEA